eukprot:3157108-Pyramimonas_sp.AAC.1
MPIDDLRHWFNPIGGIAAHPTCPNCLQPKPGSMLGHMCLHPKVACRAGRSIAHAVSDLFPHLPVRVPLREAERVAWVRAPVQPATVDTIPEPGCACYPPVTEWDHARQLIEAAADATALAPAWDA